jgi:tRNA-2-methylthio-N6-dimethylallyladenosine synthase
MEDNVPDEVKRDRLKRLNDLMAEISREKNEQLRGQIVELLVEGESKTNPDMLSGRTRTNKLVHFKGPKELAGQFVHVKITEPQTWVLKGELVSAESAKVV